MRQIVIPPEMYDAKKNPRIAEAREKMYRTQQRISGEMRMNIYTIRIPHRRPEF